MRIPAVCAAVAVVTLLAWGFTQVVPASPGAYVAGRREAVGRLLNHGLSPVLHGAAGR